MLYIKGLFFFMCCRVFFFFLSLGFCMKNLESGIKYFVFRNNEILF